MIFTNYLLHLYKFNIILTQKYSEKKTITIIKNKNININLDGLLSVYSILMY